MSNIPPSEDSLFIHIKQGIKSNHHWIILFSFIITVVTIGLSPLYAPWKQVLSHIDMFILSLGFLVLSPLYNPWQDSFYAYNMHKISPSANIPPPDITSFDIIGGVSFLCLTVYIFTQLLICASYYQQHKTRLPLRDFHKFTFSCVKKQLAIFLSILPGMIILGAGLGVPIALFSTFLPDAYESMLNVIIIMWTLGFFILILLLNLYFVSVTDKNHISSFEKTIYRLKKVFWQFFKKILLYGLAFTLINILSDIIIIELLALTKTNSMLDSTPWIVTFFTTYFNMYLLMIQFFITSTISSYYYIKSESS